MTFKDTRQIIKMSTTEGQRLSPKTALQKSTELIPHNVQNMPVLAILIQENMLLEGRIEKLKMYSGKVRVFIMSGVGIRYASKQYCLCSEVHFIPILNCPLTNGS